MTFSNGTFSPHPLANPFNTRLGGSNISFNPLIAKTPVIHKVSDPKTLQVPNQDIPMYGSDEWNQKYQANNDLQVPNQDIPLGDQSRMNGFLKKSSLFQCLDGTILDYKTGKVIYSPNDPKSEYYGNPNDHIYNTETENCWNDNDSPSIQQMIDNIDLYNNSLANDQHQSLMQIDPASAKYWLNAQKEAAKLQSQMTDEQRQLIAKFEQHFPTSRLIEESLKTNIERKPDANNR